MLIKEAMAWAGFPVSEDRADQVYGVIMDHPEGIWLGQLDPERNLDFVNTVDGRIHLHVPELATWLADVTSQAEESAMAMDEAFPLILMAGWHYDFNANISCLIIKS